MPSPNFTFQNVSSGGVAQAAQQATNIQNQAADRITGAFDTLGDIAKDNVEREAEEFRSVGETNLQAEINKITNIDDVDELNELDLDEGALRAQFGNQLGREGFEKGFAKLQGAIDSEIKSETSKELAGFERKDTLDERLNEDLFSDYRALNPGKSSAELRDGYQAHIQELSGTRNDIPKDAVEFGKKKAFGLSAAEEGKTEGQKQTEAKRLADLKGDLVESKGTLARNKEKYDKLGGSAVHTGLTASQRYTAAQDAFLAGGVDVASLGFDQAGTEDTDALIENSVKATDFIEDTIVQQDKIFKNNVIAQLNREERALKKAVSSAGSQEARQKAQSELSAKTAEIAKVVNNTSSLQVTGPLLKEILTPQMLYQPGNWLANGELDVEALKANFAREFRKPGSPLRRAMIAAYGTQGDARALAATIDKQGIATVTAEADVARRTR